MFASLTASEILLSLMLGSLETWIASADNGFATLFDVDIELLLSISCLLVDLEIIIGLDSLLPEVGRFSIGTTTFLLVGGSAVNLRGA